MIGTKITARNFVQTLAVNVSNKKLSDEAFRELVRNTVMHVEGGQLHGNFVLTGEKNDVKTYKQTK